MKNLNRILLVAAATTALWNASCVDTSGSLIPNPLLAGSVQQNREISLEENRERQYGLPPGSLGSEASMVSLDAKEVCFNVTVRTVSDRPDLVDPQSWKVFLRGTPEFEDMSPLHRGATQPTQQQLPGMIQQTQTEQERICDQSGFNCYTRNITRNVAVPSTLTLLTGGGTVCFANKGYLGPKTERMTLLMDDPRTSWPAQRRIEFSWRFK